jgi:hypothetical protein
VRPILTSFLVSESGPVWSRDDPLVLPALTDLPVGWSWLIAPRRTHLDLDADPVRLYSVQSADAYRVLAERGWLTGDPGFAEPEFVDAYAWLAAQMNRRLPTQGEAMLWAWVRIARRDLVWDFGRQRGSVLLTLEVPRVRVLVHSYGDWHMPLNRSVHLLPEPGESLEAWSLRTDPISEAFDARVKAAVGDLGVPVSQWPDELRDEIETSWRAIFDPETWDPGTAVQATLHEIRASDVVRAVRIL